MNEIYLYKKNHKSSKTINIGLSYPSTYFYGMSVLGFLSLFKEFDMNEKVSAQRLFLNSKNLAFEPKKLDLLGFSCIFELDILQILKILKKYHFKLFSSKRRRKMPLIFAGGPVITSNPEPFADFFDFMIIGDGEGIADKITEVYSKNRRKTKIEILKELAKIEGIYVPVLYDVKYRGNQIKQFLPLCSDVPSFVQKRISNSEKCLYSPIISENTYYSNTVFIEVARGCPFECKFCSAHWQNCPVRFYDLKHIKKAIKKAAKYAQKIVFIGAMITHHPDFNEICLYLSKLRAKRNFQVEFSSLSFEYPISNLPELLDEKTVSLAIECGDEKLRFETCKELTNEKIYEIIDFYSQRGIQKFNLYFMIGLPNETQENVDNYLDFAVELAKRFENVKFQHIVSAFIPKPATPFEREARKSNAVLKDYIEKIKSVLTENGVDVILPMLQNDEFSTLISLGDRRLSKYIEHIFEKNIPVKDMFKEYKRFMKKYNAKVSACEKLPHYSYYCYKQKSQDQILPWGFIKYS